MGSPTLSIMYAGDQLVARQALRAVAAQVAGDVGVALVSQELGGTV